MDESFDGPRPADPTTRSRNLGDVTSGFAQVPTDATAGIAPARNGSALGVLQFSDPRAADAEVRAVDSHGRKEHERINAAANEVARYHTPTDVQAAAHFRLSDALAYFLAEIVRTCPSGPERSTAISRAREAKMWASAAIALEGK